MNTERIVEKGYDKLARLYHQRRIERFWTVAPDVDAMTKRLAPQSSILDVGCGSGYIASILEAKGFRVTGIDLSTKMLELARANAPQPKFIRMDMKRLNFPRESFDGVICLYSFFHVPRRYHLGILRRFRSVLRPKGFLAIHMGWRGWVGTEENWLGNGAPMYWSHYGRGKNIALAGRPSLTSSFRRRRGGRHGS